MNCRDFKRLINEQLDAREAPSAEIERALEGHGSACPSCRAEALRYQALRQAIAAWNTPPSASADFADRFLDHWEHVRDEPVSVPRFLAIRQAALPLAAAAALLVAVLFAARSDRRAVRPAPTGGSPPIAAAIDPDALSLALAEATSATWDLARATSAPAARVGLEVLDASGTSESLTLAIATSRPTEDGRSSDVLQDVSDRVNEGIRPLSGTARHAFDFLLGPALERPQAPPASSEGA